MQITLQSIKSQITSRPRCDYMHRHCRKIQDDIIKMHKNGQKVDEDFFTNYLIYLLNKPIYSYIRRGCLFNTNNWIHGVKEICKYINPTTENLEQIVHIDGPEICELLEFLIKRNIKIDNSVLKIAILNKSKTVIDYLLHHIHVDVSCLELLCKHIDMNKVTFELLNRKIIPTVTCLEIAIREGNHEIIHLLIQYGVYPDNTCLMAACKEIDKKIISKLLEYDIIPTKECYNTLFNDRYCRYGLWGNIRKNIIRIIDIFVEHGYKVDHDDVVTALKYRCYINNIERFNIHFEKDFYEKYSCHGCYPYDNIKPTIKCLIKECGTVGNISAVKQLCNMGIKPTIKCLQAACNRRSNMPIVRYLINKHGLKSDIQCLKNNARYIGRQRKTLPLTIDLFEASLNKKNDEQETALQTLKDVIARTRNKNILFLIEHFEPKKKDVIQKQKNVLDKEMLLPIYNA